MLLLAQGSVVLFDYASRDYLAERLQEDAESLVAAPIREEGEMRLDPLRLRASFNRVYSGHYFIIDVDDEFHLRSRSLWDHRLDPGNGLSDQLQRGPQGQSLLVWTGHYTRGGHDFVITTALDYTPITERLSWLRWCIWALGGTLAVMLVLVQRRVIRLGLRPLEKLRKELAQLHEGQRMTLETRVPDEIAPVVEELNHQLSRIEQVLNRSRDGIANLGHALKTPLAVLETLLVRRELNNIPEFRDALRTRLDEIHRLVERELQRARLDTCEVSPAARFRPDSDLPPLLDTLREIHGPAINFTTSVELNTPLPWDRDELLEVLGNLLDNAGKWAKSQARLTLLHEQSQLIMRVDDDGPGIAPQHREDVLHRGTRLDEQVAGHGLGLGIVEQIVTHHKGRLRLDESPFGGLAVIVEMPWPSTGE
ncbi:sensor histidine kinase [Phytohalomonas tamaricis]|uniref:sensor histidine kinase n=1 Tax=Phytohalomonas tamaricis TaxID=2081032 RepID=UPI001319C897|nr:sensor histidine kinase [Phytohalomonas tamaricis]